MEATWIRVLCPYLTLNCGLFIVIVFILKQWLLGLQRYTEISVYLPNTGLLITDRIPTDFLTFYRIPTSSKYLSSVSNMGRYSLTGRYYHEIPRNTAENTAQYRQISRNSTENTAKYRWKYRKIPLKKPIRNTDRGAESVYRNFGIIWNSDRDFWIPTGYLPT